jgi:hypothetical protein
MWAVKFSLWHGWTLKLFHLLRRLFTTFELHTWLYWLRWGHNKLSLRLSKRVRSWWSYQTFSFETRRHFLCLSRVFEISQIYLNIKWGIFFGDNFLSRWLHKNLLFCRWKRHPFEFTFWAPYWYLNNFFLLTYRQTTLPISKIS